MLPLFTEETMSKYLTTAEVLPFLHGCCGTYMLDGYTCFSRFTAEELAYYGDRSGTDFVRSYSVMRKRYTAIYRMTKKASE